MELKFRMTVGDRTHEVEIGQSNSQGKNMPAKVNIDGRVINVAIIEKDESSGMTKVKVNDKEYKVAVEDSNILAGKSVNVKLNEALFQIKIDTLAGSLIQPAEARLPKAPEVSRIGEPLTKAATGVSSVGGKSIRPPMPGRIISLKVKEGDTVKIGDVVLILEAMKMANEIISPFSGKVREVRVSPGQSVAPEDVVISIE